jgi:hypothetical protein
VNMRNPSRRRNPKTDNRPIVLKEMVLSDDKKKLIIMYEYAKVPEIKVTKSDTPTPSPKKFDNRLYILGYV